MTDVSNRNRISAGVRAGGRFAVEDRPEANLSLGQPPTTPTLGTSVVRGMAREIADLDDGELDVMVPRLASSLHQSGDYSDVNVSEEIDRIGYDEWGFRPSDRADYRRVLADQPDHVREAVERYVSDLSGAGSWGDEHDAAAEADHLTYLREKLDGPAVLPAGTPSDPVPASDPRAQSGEVFDTVEVDGVAFHRRRDDVYPDYPYAMRIQADRPLSDDEMSHMSQLAGYSLAATRQGEPMGDPERDTPYSFVVHADTTKGRQGRSLDRFEENLATFVREGSPVRKTDRAGAGTAGTRLVEGMGSNAPKFELYYDSVFGDGC